MILLYLDVLGTRSRWHAEGRTGAEAIFEKLRLLTLNSVRRVGADQFDLVGIESDSIVARSASVNATLRLAREMFTTLFMEYGIESINRLWIRGSILGSGGPDPLRTEEVCPAPLGQVTTFRYSPSLLDAIAVERSGVKGMRLLIQKNLVDGFTRTSNQVLIDGSWVYPFRVLEFSNYPPRVKSEFEDYLWMLGDIPDWEQVRRAMSNRLRYASRDSEEFLHAASTQVVFNECEAIVRAGLRRHSS